MATAMIEHPVYTVRPVDSDPPRYAVFAPDGERITRPLPDRETYAALVDFANEVRRRALEEREAQA